MLGRALVIILTVCHSASFRRAVNGSRRPRPWPRPRMETQGPAVASTERGQYGSAASQTARWKQRLIFLGVGLVRVRGLAGK
jgi:hypothetical protein